MTPELFMSKVEKTPGCWIWTGATTGSGYGTVYLGTASTGAHRASYELFVGPIRDGKHIDHRCHGDDLTCKGGITCRHRRCVNPDHLEAVTRTENMRRGVRARVTQCPFGHEYTEANTYRYAGQRFCRACSSRRGTERRRRAREAIAA